MQSNVQSNEDVQSNKRMTVGPLRAGYGLDWTQDFKTNRKDSSILAANRAINAIVAI
jgi:hypothetical protein